MVTPPLKEGTFPPATHVLTVSVGQNPRFSPGVKMPMFDTAPYGALLIKRYPLVN